MQYISILLTIITINNQLLAKVMQIDAQTSYGLYGASHFIQAPTTQRQQRYSIIVDYKTPILRPFGLLLGTQLSPDSTTKSQKIDIKEHIYQTYSLVTISLIYLFRIAVGIGGGIYYTRYEQNILGQRNHKVVIVATMISSIMIDYAINDSIEISSQINYQHRYWFNKQDWSMGLGIRYNWP